PLSDRVEAAVRRMEDVPRLLDEGRRSLRTAPSEWTARAIRECDGALAFFREGIAFLAAEEGVAVRGLEAAAERAARAFATFRDHLDRELRRHPSDRYACGEEALALHLREGHFLADHADEIARYAEAELAEARAHLADHARDFGASSPGQALAG